MSPQSSNIIFNRNIIKEAIEKIAQTVSTDIPHPEIPDEVFEIFVYLPPSPAASLPRQRPVYHFP